MGEDLILRTVGQPVARTLRVLSAVESQRLGELGIVRWTYSKTQTQIQGQVRPVDVYRQVTHSPVLSQQAQPLPSPGVQDQHLYSLFLLHAPVSSQALMRPLSGRLIRSVDYDVGEGQAAGALILPQAGVTSGCTSAKSCVKWNRPPAPECGSGGVIGLIT